MSEFQDIERPHPRILSPEDLQENELYRELVTQIDTDHFPDVRDAQLFIRKDGLIVNAEGWHHPEGKLIGEVMYAPDWRGDREVFGYSYRKLTLFPGTYTPVPYGQRAALLSQYDPRLGQTDENPFFAQYKQIFDRSEFASYISGEDVLEKLLPKLAAEHPEVIDDIESVGKILGIDLTDIGLGFTGAPSFGKLDSLHDLDIIFSGDVEENLVIAKAMRETVRHQPQRRLTEGGKGWNIRFFNDRGTLICSFFTYKNPEDAPLRNFEMEVIAPSVTVEGEVYDDKHAIYTPTVLGLDRVRITHEGDEPFNGTLDEPLQLVAYHTATRGECFEGDTVRATGALVQVTTPDSTHLGICVTDREGIRNLTPTWEGFYEEE